MLCKTVGQSVYWEVDLWCTCPVNQVAPPLHSCSFCCNKRLICNLRAQVHSVNKMNGLDQINLYTFAKRSPKSQQHNQWDDWKLAEKPFANVHRLRAPKQLQTTPPHPLMLILASLILAYYCYYWHTSANTDILLLLVEYAMHRNALRTAQKSNITNRACEFIWMTGMHYV